MSSSDQNSETAIKIIGKVLSEQCHLVVGSLVTGFIFRALWLQVASVPGTGRYLFKFKLTSRKILFWEDYWTMRLKYSPNDHPFTDTLIHCLSSIQFLKLTVRLKLILICLSYLCSDCINLERIDLSKNEIDDASGLGEVLFYYLGFRKWGLG